MRPSPSKRNVVKIVRQRTLRPSVPTQGYTARASVPVKAKRRQDRSTTDAQTERPYNIVTRLVVSNRAVRPYVLSLERFADLST